MKIKVDIGKLHLPGPGAYVTEVPPDPKGPSDDQVIGAAERLVELGLTKEQVGALMRRTAEESAAQILRSSWPTVAQDREVLEAAADLALALGAILSNASPRAKLEFFQAGEKFVGAGGFSDAASQQLLLFSAGLRQRIEGMPKQTYRQAHTGVVRALAEIAGDRLGAITTYADSKFYIACQCAFVLAGYSNGMNSNPDRAIKSYLEQLGEGQKKRDTNRP